MDGLYCVKENQPPPACHSLYLSIFLSLQWKFPSQNSRFLWAPKSPNFVCTLKGTKYIVGKKTKMLWLIFAFFLHFSISHSNVIHREICIKDLSGTTAPRSLKFGTNVGYDLFCCVKENQHAAAAYHSLYLSISLSIQATFLLKKISQLLWGSGWGLLIRE